MHAGDTVDLRVTLRPYAGAEYVETVPVIIPRTVAGQTVKIEVASGAMVRPDMPQAESLPVYIDNLRKSYSASAIVVTLQTPDDGASLRGRLISGLPASALDTLRPGNQTRRADAYHVADRTLFPARQLVSGKQELTRRHQGRRPRPAHPVNRAWGHGPRGGRAKTRASFTISPRCE